MQLSVFQISAVVLVVTEVNPKPNPKRGPLVAWSFIAWVAKSQAWCVDALRSVHFAHSFNILAQQLIKFSFKPASACNSLGVCFCNFVFWLNHLPVRFNNRKREKEPKQHFFPMLTVCHRCCTLEFSHRGPCVRCRLSLRRCPSPPGRFTPASSCFFFFPAAPSLVYSKEMYTTSAAHTWWTSSSRLPDCVGFRLRRVSAHTLLPGGLEQSRRTSPGVLLVASCGAA